MGMMEIGEILEGINSKIKGFSTKNTVEKFRKINRLCVILDNGEIHMVHGNYYGMSSSIEKYVQDSLSRGYVRISVFDNYEKYRIIPVSRVMEFTLGDLDMNSKEFMGMFEKLGHDLNNIFGDPMGFEARNEQNLKRNDLHSSNSFNQNP